jgi:hypothetical protein
MTRSPLTGIPDARLYNLAREVEAERAPDEWETDDPFFAFTVPELRRFGELLIQRIAEGS